MSPSPNNPSPLPPILRAAHAAAHCSRLPPTLLLLPVLSYAAPCGAAEQCYQPHCSSPAVREHGPGFGRRRCCTVGQGSWHCKGVHGAEQRLSLQAMGAAGSTHCKVLHGVAGSAWCRQCLIQGNTWFRGRPVVRGAGSACCCRTVRNVSSARHCRAMHGEDGTKCSAAQQCGAW